MVRGGVSSRFEHIVFPREEKRRVAINLAPDCSSTATSKTFANWPKEDLEFVQSLLAQAGLDVSHYRSETLLRRLPACLRTLRAQSVTHAMELLKESPISSQVAISSLLVGVTSFFRDPTVFEQLKGEIEHDVNLVKHGLHVWSIGCSEGAELYSMALILAETGRLSSCYLLGTDCRADAIERAKTALFDNTLTTQIPDLLKERYFERHGKCQQLSASIRQVIRWRVSSILNELESGLWDIIFFRNTALYLRPDIVSNLWPKLESALRPGGLLVLGRAERPSGVQRLRAIGPCIYRRYSR